MLCGNEYPVMFSLTSPLRTLSLENFLLEITLPTHSQLKVLQLVLKKFKSSDLQKLGKFVFKTPIHTKTET